MGDGDLITTEIAVRLALLQSRTQTDPDGLKALYTSLTEVRSANTD